MIYKTVRLTNCPTSSESSNKELNWSCKLNTSWTRPGPGLKSSGAQEMLSGCEFTRPNLMYRLGPILEFWPGPTGPKEAGIL